MIKRPFLLFISIVSILIGLLIGFIQSRQFTWTLKALAYRYLPKDIGIQGDFSEISIRIFPPGLSLEMPRIQLGERNILNLPAGSTISAEKIDFNFRFFQIFSGDIRVHEVNVVNGEIHLILGSKPSLPSGISGPASISGSKSVSKTLGKLDKLNFHWDELFQIKADSLALSHVKLFVQMTLSQQPFETEVKFLRLAQWQGHGGLGYHVTLDLEKVQGGFLNPLGFPEKVEYIQGEAHLNALGMRLDSLFIGNPSLPGGLDASIQGQVNGNILEPKKLVAELQLRAKGEIGQVFKVLPIALAQPEMPHGWISVSGKVKGDLVKPMDTVHIEGQLLGKQMAYRNWTADSVSVDAKWDASPSGGTVSLVRALIASRERERLGGYQAGSGGRVELGPVRWVWGSTASLAVPIRLERAHIHWIGAAALKELYPLDFRVTGTVGASFSPPLRDRDWKLDAKLNLALDSFQLDNQRYLKNKPLIALLKIPKIGLAGQIVLNSRELRSNNVFLTFGKLEQTKLAVNGRIHFKTGYDLTGIGPMRLGDLGTLSQSEIRGHGNVAIHVHGPASNVMVDFDVDLKEAYYLNLALGNVQGKLVWDDHLNHLLFNHLKVVKNSTPCIVDGILVSADPSAITLNVSVGNGNIQDLFEIFGSMTRPLSWFPHDLQGGVQGDIQIRGGIDLSQLQVTTHLQGTRWQYWGERMNQVNLVGEYNRGQYSLREFKILKKTGEIFGDVTYRADSTLIWHLHTQDFLISDFDQMIQLDVPIRGNVRLESSGQGVQGKIESKSDISLSEMTIRGMRIPSSRLSWTTGKGISHIQAMAMGGQANVEVAYDFNPRELSLCRAEFKKFDFAPLLFLINPKSSQDKSIEGVLSGKAEFTFHAGQSEQLSGYLSLKEFLLARSDARFSLKEPVLTNVSNGNFALEGLSIQGQSGEVTIDLASTQGVLSGGVRGNLDLSFLEFFTPAITQLVGTANLDFIMGGTPSQPTFLGSAEFQGGSLRVASLDSPFENITGSIQLRQNVLSIQGLRSDLGGGFVTAEGRIILHSDHYPELMLRTKIRNSKIKVFPFQYVQLGGLIDIRGDDLPYGIDGRLVISSALSKEKVFTQAQGAGALKAVPYAPPLTKVQESSASKFKLNVGVDADREVFIQNDLFRDVEAKGNLTLVGDLESPKILGRAEVVHGKLIFKDHVFQIQNATANFDNPNLINPSFDLNANTEVNGIKIQLYASGRLNKINKIEFVSNPSMQESEILSLLAVGLTSNDTKKLSSSDQNAVQQGEVTSLLLHTLDFNRDFEDKTGFQVQLDESMNPQQGVSAFRPQQTQTDAAIAPQITIRKKLGDHLVLSAGSTVGVGSNKSNQVNLDYSVGSDLSVSGVYSSYVNTGSTADAEQSTQNSFGLDLKFQKRFK